MPGARILLYAALVLVNVAFIATWIATAKRRHFHERPRPSDVAIGFGTNFLDTLGIGSYSQMTALFKLRGDPVRWLVMIVIVYAAASMLRSARLDSHRVASAPAEGGS
jgi:hypothetical protein